MPDITTETLHLAADALFHWKIRLIIDATLYRLDPDSPGRQRQQTLMTQIDLALQELDQCLKNNSNN